MADETITVRASGDEPERVFERDTGHLAVTVRRFKRSLESDAIYPSEGQPYSERRVIYGAGRLDFTERFGSIDGALVEVFEGREVRVSIVDRGDDSAAYAKGDLAFGFSVEPERFEALWRAAREMPDAELQVTGDMEVYRPPGRV